MTTDHNYHDNNEYSYFKRKNMIKVLVQNSFSIQANSIALAIFILYIYVYTHKFNYMMIMIFKKINNIYPN